MKTVRILNKLVTSTPFTAAISIVLDIIHILKKTLIKVSNSHMFYCALSTLAISTHISNKIIFSPFSTVLLLHFVVVLFVRCPPFQQILILFTGSAVLYRCCPALFHISQQVLVLSIRLLLHYPGYSDMISTTFPTMLSTFCTYPFALIVYITSI